MFKKKTYISLILLLFISSCGDSWDSFKRGMTGQKQVSKDEFLVKKKDPLIEAAKFFEKKEARFPKMSNYTYKWISPLYKNLTRKTRRVIAAACKLHDVAWVAHPDYKTEMCLELVTRSNISGLSHKERVFLAMILLFRHKAKPEKIFNSKLFKIVSKKITRL